MLKVGLLCGVIAAMTATGIRLGLDSKVESKEANARFIVELDEDIDNISAEKAIKQQEGVFNSIKRRVNKNVELDRNFTILNNAFVISGNKSDLQGILEIPGVKNVTEDGTHIVRHTEGSNGFSISLNREGGGAIDLSENASAITMNKPDDTNDGEGTFIAVLDNEFYLKGKTATNEPYNHATFTALDESVKLRLSSFGHARARIAGTHADKNANSKVAGTEGSLYFNNKVPFYYDYAGDSYTGSSSGATEDFDVESKIDLHGSHVASIAAGNDLGDGGDDKGYKGIAPKAQLALMKVFSDVHKTPASESVGSGNYGSFSEIAFLTALEDAIIMKVDAINVSIGSDLSDFEQGSISQRTLDKVAKNGILSAISAGNGGKTSYSSIGGYANWTRDIVETGVMGSFANNASTNTVASGQPEWTYYENALSVGDRAIPYNDQIVNRDGESTYNREFRLTQILGDMLAPKLGPDDDPSPEQQELDVPYVYVNGFGSAEDYQGKDVNGKIAIVNRGKTDFSSKYEVAADKGAKALLIINNDPTESDFTFTCDFGDSKGSINRPVALLLFKDKEFFDENKTGTFKIKKYVTSKNLLADTISEFSTDGATYDLDLKPEITAPGSNIRGAVWPQNKKEKEHNLYNAYEYFNGTSMAAPNYEGAMAVVLSKVTKDYVAKGYTTPEEEDKIREYRETIPMKIMSTAKPMLDAKENEESHVKSITSPRMQGAGMVDIDAAYDTEVYVRGSDTKTPGVELDASKINLRNSDAIANGKIQLNFTLVNESSSPKSFKVSYNVMRPSLAYTNKILTDDYATPLEVSDVKEIPGWPYYALEGGGHMTVGDGTASYKDTIKVSKTIDYYSCEQDAIDDVKRGHIPEGIYYCSSMIDKSKEGIVWEEVPKIAYQSVKDVEIATVDGPDVVVPANGKLLVSLPEYSLSEDAKNQIASYYETGTYIEGYVSLSSNDNPNLSIPYMGFYSLTDKHADYSYSTPDVVEPFEFEKDPLRVYGSDLINDVTKQFLGKDNVEFGSLMVAGYAKNIKNVNLDSVANNDLSIKQINGFYPVGTAPTGGSDNPYTDTPANDIYVGNPLKSNTLIIQQFVMRSVKDNNFTIVNKETGQEVYRSALTDMLFGTQFGKAVLYKSHVDADYIGSGYVAHRAIGVVPLYNPDTKVAFPSGEYELKFNYQLAATDEWVSKAYNLHIDSESPVVSSILDFKQDGKDMVRITFKDMRCAYAIIGSNKVDVKFDDKEKVYYVDVEKSLIDASINKNKTEFSDSRLVIRAVDYARGETVAIVHFTGNDYSHFQIAQGQGFSINADFKYENDQLKIYDYDANGNKFEVISELGFTYISGVPVAKADLGLILGVSLGGGVLVLGGAGVLVYIFVFKKKKMEVNKNEKD